jgi:hypothetical protein
MEFQFNREMEALKTVTQHVTGIEVGLLLDPWNLATRGEGPQSTEEKTVPWEELLLPRLLPLFRGAEGGNPPGRNNGHDQTFDCPGLLGK